MTRAMRLARLALMVLFALAGCGVPNTSAKLVSRAEPGKLVPLARVLVVMRARSWQARPSLYKDFKDAMLDRLTLCRVTPKMWFMGQQPDDTEHFADDLQAFQPDAVAYIRDTEGHLEGTRKQLTAEYLAELSNEFVKQGNAKLGIAVGLASLMFPPYGRVRVFFDLTLFDARSAESMWQARSVLDLIIGHPLETEQEAVDRLAVAIVSTLRDDGVLQGCPAEWPTMVPPDCMQTRRGMLDAARQLPTPRERIRAMREAPTCQR